MHAMLISVSHPRWVPCQAVSRPADMSRTVDGMKSQRGQPVAAEAGPMQEPHM
jgi:hypothetical protein